MMVNLIKQRDLEIAFPNLNAREAFLDIMKGLVMVDPIDNAIVINVDDPRPVIIRRLGKQIYSDGD